MTVSPLRATVYAVLFGLAVAINVYLWVETDDTWRALLAFVAFAACMGLLKFSFGVAAGDAMSEHGIKTLGAEE